MSWFHAMIQGNCNPGEKQIDILLLRQRDVQLYGEYYVMVPRMICGNCIHGGNQLDVMLLRQRDV